MSPRAGNVTRACVSCAVSTCPRVLGRHIAELLLSLVNKPFEVTFAVSGCPFLITGVVAAVHRIYVLNEEKASIVADFSPNST